MNIFSFKGHSQDDVIKQAEEAVGDEAFIIELKMIRDEKSKKFIYELVVASIGNIKKTEFD